MKEALLESKSVKYAMCVHKRLRACLRTYARAYAYAVNKEKVPVCEKIVREIEKKVVCEKIICECDTHTHTHTDGLKKGAQRVKSIKLLLLL